MGVTTGAGRVWQLAGAFAGGAGLLVFLLLHHAWIVPIWFVAPIAVPVAVAGGIVVATAHRELLPHLPRRPWTASAWFGLIGVSLLPALLLAEAREPMFDLGGPGGAVLLMSPARATGVFVLELLLTSSLVGAAAGWLIGRTRRAVMAMAAAGFVFAIGPGHNIPFGGGTAAVPLEVAIMAAVAAVSAGVLVESYALLLATETESRRAGGVVDAAQPRSSSGRKLRSSGPR
jgi:hypothetical protein